MSCNGCRVLRKGCSDTCILRSSLRWIESPEAQGYATMFVAKFFGRAGMMSFIGAVLESQRPALFQSLLYEACGRTVNPVFGAVGLLWSGKWAVCQAAVETVLKGGAVEPAPCLIAPCSPKPMHHLLKSRPLAITHKSSSSLWPMSSNSSLKRSQQYRQPTDISNKRSRHRISNHERVSPSMQEVTGPHKNRIIDDGLPSKQHVDLATKLAPLSAPEFTITNLLNTKPLSYTDRELQASQSESIVLNCVSTAPLMRDSEKMGMQGAMLCNEDSGRGSNIELDLTLTSHAGDLADHGKEDGPNADSSAFGRVSSPHSSFSPRSEGSSVTNAEASEFFGSYNWRTSSVYRPWPQERKLLHLL